MRISDWCSDVCSSDLIFHGWYLNELLMRLLQRQDPHPALFEAYALAMQQLPGDADAAHDALRIFERDLLAEIGYGLHLPADLEADRRYRYHSEIGRASCRERVCQYV